jgi:hypothetical protein
MTDGPVDHPRWACPLSSCGSCLVRGQRYASWVEGDTDDVQPVAQTRPTTSAGVGVRVEQDNDITVPNLQYEMPSSREVGVSSSRPVETVYVPPAIDVFGSGLVAGVLALMTSEAVGFKVPIVAFSLAFAAVVVVGFLYMAWRDRRMYLQQYASARQRSAGSARPRADVAP